MTPGVRPLVAGNWKMNGLSASLAEIDAMRKAVDAGEAGPGRAAVCPPATLIAQAALRIGEPDLSLGAQDCTPESSGAFTGDISAAMLKDAGAAYVIVGHSERRTYHHETDELVRAKAEAALKAGLTPIICVGETHAEREAGQQAAVVIRQLRGSLPPEASSETVVVAYEPIWAIGTGLTPTPKDIAAVHNGIRALLADMFGAAVRQNPPSLWRLGQAEQLQRALDPRQCRRRAGRRREPESDGIPGHRRRLSLRRVRLRVRWTPPLRHVRSAPSFEDAGPQARRSGRSRPSCNPF